MSDNEAIGDAEQKSISALFWVTLSLLLLQLLGAFIALYVFIFSIELIYSNHVSSINVIVIVLATDFSLFATIIGVIGVYKENNVLCLIYGTAMACMSLFDTSLAIALPLVGSIIAAAIHLFAALFTFFFVGLI